MKKTSPSPFATAEYKANPYAFYEELRRDRPVYKTLLPNGTEVYVVSRYEDVLAGLKDSRLIKDISKVRGKSFWEMIGIGRMRGKNMLRADPPEHGRLRSLANEAFKPKYVRELRGRIQQMADELIDKVQGKGKMEFISEFAFPLPIRVISEMLGVPEKDQDKFRKWSGDLINSGALSSERPAISSDLLQLVQYVRKVVDEHRKKPRADVVTQLIEAEEKGDRLSDDEVVSTVVLLLVAGHETTVNLIGNGMLAFFDNPEQFEHLRGRPELVEQAVEELLRFAPPVEYGVPRHAVSDVQMGDVTIPRGDRAIALLSAANRDERIFENADRLDVTREKNRQITFGLGLHFCLGAPLARREGAIAFRALAQRFPNLSLDVPRGDVEWWNIAGLRGLKKLPVRLS